MTPPTHCNVVTEYHVGPLDTTVGGHGRYEMLVDRCRSCGYEYAITTLTPERAAAVRRAEAEGRMPSHPVYGPSR